jgi:serine protease Do
MSKVKVVAASAFVLLVASACGGGGGGAGDSSSSSASAKASSAASASASGSAAAGGAVTSYHNAQGAVIQIKAEGEYRDVGMAEGSQGAWSGSGFIIDPSGIAVTNAHVAEGAATMKVYVGGSTDPINAKILGVSECNDLAVIDLEGGGFPYLKWHQGPIDVTTNVWAAGFPLGDPQYTVTDGTIAKNNASGDTSWASMDHTLEMTATIEPGNSGGPLLAEDGSVVGINYSSFSAPNTSQYFAIPADVAIPVVEVLRKGQDQDSIGVNGTAFYDDKNALGGIWVASVRSGSPASDAGMQAGDIITKMEARDAVANSDVSTAGSAAQVTKSGYCNVLRTQGSDHAIKVQVYRSSTGEVLEGEVNNPDKPLAAISAINNNSAGQTDSSTAPSSDTSSADVTYSTVEDSSGTISAEVPDVWNDVKTADSEIIATADQAAFNDGTATGIDFYVSTGSIPAKQLKATMKKIEGNKDIDKILSTCKDSEAGKVQDGDGYSYIGNSYWSCQGSDLSYYLSIRSYPDQDKSVLILGAFTTDQDVEFVNRSLASLVVK